MDPVSLFWILMFFASPAVWQVLCIISILAMVAVGLLWLAAHLVSAFGGAVELGRRLRQGDRVVIACTLSAAIYLAPLLAPLLAVFFIH